jgi:hypothetical protein
MSTATNGHSAGLCMTCNNSPECVHRLRRGFDAISCEMFTDHAEPLAQGRRTKAAYPVAVSAASVHDEKSVRLQGLCTNCDNRKICTYVKPDSGVWHCEEYR